MDEQLGAVHSNRKGIGQGYVSSAQLHGSYANLHTNENENFLATLRRL